MKQLRHRIGNGAAVHKRNERGLATLIVGAGSAGSVLARDLTRCADYGLRPVAFLDDDLTKRFVEGLPVIGRLEDLSRAVRGKGIEAVVIAIPSLPNARLRLLLDAAASSAARVRYLPTFHAAMQRDPRGDDLRDLRIPALLGREELHVARSSVRNTIRGRRVLVTGAGGSIGSELCRQLRALDPASLVMLDHDESNLHTLQLTVSGEALLDTDDIVIADVRDRRRIEQVIADLRPDIIFHAAAHKHLPLLERHPCEGVKTNVWGTEVLARAAVENGVERFILISTDKAADPTSVLGATKSLAEAVVRHHGDGPTCFASVRFGNVLGSRGSFLTVVARQLALRDDVTVTHPDVERFFMTVEEAVGLVLEAASMAECGETYVLDMGEPVRIVDLVDACAAQLGVSDVKIKFTGLRPGEKLHEALFSENEVRVSTAHPKIWATNGALVADDFEEGLAALYSAAESNTPADVREALGRLLPGYTNANMPTTQTTSSKLLAHAYADDY